MYPLFFIAKNNLKKKKGDVAVLFFLIALSALLLYSSVSVLTGVTEVFDLAYERAHTADYFLLADTGLEDEIREILLSEEEVEEYERSDTLDMAAEYRTSLTEEKSNYAFLIGAIEDERNIGTLAGADTEQISPDAVLLPYYLKSGFEEGDAFYLTLGETEYQFTVTGFVEDPMFATPINVTLYSIYISRSRMDEIIGENPSIDVLSIYKVRLKEGADTGAFEDRVLERFTKEIEELSTGGYISVNWQDMRGGGSFMSYVVMGLTLIFSVLLVFVALLIVRFSIRNFMERNIKNIGILQAAGYTAGQLCCASMTEMGLIALTGVLTGILAGILGSSAIGSIQGMISGLSWNRGFCPGAAAFTIFLVLFAVICTAALSGRIYKKITVLDALRGGIHTHNFRKNFFPLEKSRLPFYLVISGKEIFGEKKKNLSVLCIVILLSVTSCIGFSLYENFGMKTDMLLELVGIETGDATVSMEDVTEISSEIAAWEEIDHVRCYGEASLKLTHGVNQCTLSCDIWDDPNLLENEMLIEGRLPVYENEIVLSTNASKELGAAVGDVIYAEGTQGLVDYLVTGIDQKTNHMGLKGILTMEGMERLNDKTHMTLLYLHTVEGVSYEDIRKKIKQSYPDAEVEDMEKVITETIEGVGFGMLAICVVFIVITSLVVMLVEILLIHSKLVKERKNYGISKALGYTTGQLVAQTMVTNLPVVLMGAVIGVLISGFLGNRLALVCFSMSGIRKVNLTVSPVWMLVTVAGILAVAAAAAFLSAVRIRKIEPVNLLAEE